MDNSKPSDEVATPVSRFRRILPQVFAGTAKNFLLIGIGTSISYATIIIPALLGGKDEISMNAYEISWFGSVYFIAQPLGSLLSGIVMEPIGRKKAMLLVNLPQIAAWIMMWCASDVTTLFAANSLLGFCTGLMEAPIITYIGEICEPSVRGVLVAYSLVFSSAGLFATYLLGTVLHWRTAAAVCLSVPVITLFAICFVPETPIWLLSKGRKEEALKSLCWLRGWVKPNLVMEEFNQLVRYNEINFKCKICEPAGLDLLPNHQCSHQQSRCKRFFDSITELNSRATLRPLLLASLFFGFSAMTSLSAIKPNMINVFKAFNMPIDANWATVGVGILSILGAIICMSLLKLCGKRPIVLVAMAGSSISTFLLGLYAYYNIPHETTTYKEIELSGETSSTPLILFVVMVLCNTIGLTPLMWAIVSEIFPYKTRGNACGIAASVSYLANFIASKTHIYMEITLHIYGSFYVYAAVTLVGMVYMYIALLETESRTHEEIEAEWNADTQCFANDCIANKIRGALQRKTGGSYNKKAAKDGDVDGSHYSDYYFNEGFELDVK